jgi:hypothetical protein
MNIKLQKEITNFVNLKMRIAFMKSGYQNYVCGDKQECFELVSDELFRDIEE